MLRLDPGRGPHPHRPRIQGLGGRRRIQRRPRPAQVLRPAHRRLHRLRRQRRRPADRGLRPAGRRRDRLHPVARRRRHRPLRPQRAQLHRARLRDPRRGRDPRPGPHRRQPAQARRLRLGPPLRQARRPLVPHRRHLRRAVRDDRGLTIEAVKAAHRHGTIVSYDLNYRPSLWKSIGGLAKAARGQPRDRQVCRRHDRQRGGLHGLASASRSRAPTHNSPTSRPTAFKTDDRKAVADFPNFKVVGDHAAQGDHRHRQRLERDLLRRRAFYESRAYPDLEILDRVGGGDSFASGLVYGFLKTGDPQKAVDYGAAHGALAMTTPATLRWPRSRRSKRSWAGGSARVVR